MLGKACTCRRWQRLSARCRHEPARIPSAHR
ncbi:MAG: SWIM zinc finger family protein [Pseudomonadaceae bacterium]|nr:SWIM zinc finger family protein [Pseudomonadaceae bacterium]